MAPKLEKPTVLAAEQSLRFRVRNLIDAFNGPFGKIAAGLIAEGQSEPGPFSMSSLTGGLVLDGMLRLRICSAARIQVSCDRRQKLNC